MSQGASMSSDVTTYENRLSYGSGTTPADTSANITQSSTNTAAHTTILASLSLLGCENISLGVLRPRRTGAASGDSSARSSLFSSSMVSSVVYRI